MDALVRLDLGSSIAPGEQLRLQLLAQVALGRLHPGDELPTPAALATASGLTVAQVCGVYTELGGAGVLADGPSAAAVAERGGPAAAAALRVAAVRIARSARDAGLDEHEILDVVHGALLGPRAAVLPSQRRPHRSERGDPTGAPAD